MPAMRQADEKLSIPAVRPGNGFLRGRPRLLADRRRGQTGAGAYEDRRTRSWQNCLGRRPVGGSHAVSAFGLLAGQDPRFVAHSDRSPHQTDVTEPDSERPTQRVTARFIRAVTNERTKS